MQGVLENTVMAGKSLLQKQLSSMVREIDFRAQLAISATDLKFFHKIFAFGELLIHSYSFYPYLSIIMTPKSPFPVPTSHRCLVLYLQPPSKHQLPYLKFNIFPRPELALVLVLPSSDSGPPFSWHHL